MITLYDLAGADPMRRFSPFCWRIKMALLHKGLPFETIAWRFTDKPVIAFAGSDKVPVLVDGAHILHDSWAIAAYLETNYPDRPSLFGGAVGQALSRFIADWSETVIHPALFRLICVDIFHHLAPQDRDYFRQSREARIGASLEDYCADPESRIEPFRASLTPLRRTVGRQDFLAGAAPAWADYVAFAPFQWARCVSPLKLLAGDDPVAQWRERMLDFFDGAARDAVGYDAK